jgi:hypothetical protein
LPYLWPKKDTGSRDRKIVFIVAISMQFEAIFIRKEREIF